MFTGEGNYEIPAPKKERVQKKASFDLPVSQKFQDNQKKARPSGVNESWTCKSEEL